MIKWRVIDAKTRHWEVFLGNGTIIQKGNTESLVFYINRVGYWEFNPHQLSVVSRKMYFIR